LSVGASLIDQYDPNNNFVFYTNTGDATGSTTTAIKTNNSAQLWSFGMEKNDTHIANVAPSPSPTPSPRPPQVNTVFLDHYTTIPASTPIGGRPLRGVGEFGYGIKTNLPPVGGFLQTLDFYTATSTDAPVLDFFSYNKADPASGGVPVRSGIVSLNTRQPPVLAALLTGQLLKETLPATTVTSAQATTAANTIVNAANTPGGVTPYGPALSRADIVRLASLVTSAPFDTGSSPATKEVREAIPRALAENVQVRTWGLLIDLVAQTGHYSPNAQGLSDFIVEGEKRYWLHIAIDRFDGTVVGQQLEEALQ